MTVANIQLNSSTIFAGLGTATFTVVTTGLYTAAFTATIPYTPAGTSNNSAAAAPSALSVVINQDTGGGPVAKLTVASPGATQPIVGGKVVLSCTAGDVITYVLTSANTADNQLNSIKTTINFYQGE